jgi:hypothetical protein
VYPEGAGVVQKSSVACGHTPALQVDTSLAVCLFVFGKDLSGGGCKLVHTISYERLVRRRIDIEAGEMRRLISQGEDKVEVGFGFWEADPRDDGSGSVHSADQPAPTKGSKTLTSNSLEAYRRLCDGLLRSYKHLTRLAQGYWQAKIKLVQGKRMCFPDHGGSSSRPSWWRSRQ